MTLFSKVLRYPKGQSLALALATLAFTSVLPAQSTPSYYVGADESAPAMFSLQENIVGKDFYETFQWETLDDPTRGRVNYVDQKTASERNLTFVTGDSFVMRADDLNVVSPEARGRDSNRIISYAKYTDSVIVLDVQHMPTGCATWPAFWTLSTDSPWPNGGEIDIIEGVNTNTANLASLHTSPGCTMPQERRQSGNVTSTDCNAFANSNQGCGSNFVKPNSFGSPFNRAQGGWFAMRRTQRDGVAVWFWGRDDPNVPMDVRHGGHGGMQHVFADENTWGVPEARFPASDTCDFEEKFNAHHIIINLTFCGDWAGNVFAQSGCGASYDACNDFVNNHPEAFGEAYWEINALRIYTPTF